MDQNNRPDQTPPPSTSERIRKDFSFAQVFASVLSTVTCMALAPKIGLLGGLLGGAIGAGVAACATQLYRSILNATSEKLKYKQQLLLNQQAPMEDANTSSEETTPAASGLTEQMKALAEDSLLNTMGLPKVESSASAQEMEHATADVPQAAEEAPQRSSQTPQDVPYVSHLLKYVLVIVGVTMLSVILSVAIITYATEGEGLGRKPEVVYITKYINQGSTSSESKTIDAQGNSSQSSSNSAQTNTDDGKVAGDSDSTQNTTPEQDKGTSESETSGENSESLDQNSSTSLDKPAQSDKSST